MIAGSVSQRGAAREFAISPRLRWERAHSGLALNPDAFAEREVHDAENEDRTHYDPENSRCASVVHDLYSSHIMLQQRAAGKKGSISGLMVRTDGKRNLLSDADGAELVELLHFGGGEGAGLLSALGGR